MTDDKRQESARRGGYRSGQAKLLAYLPSTKQDARGSTRDAETHDLVSFGKKERPPLGPEGGSLEAQTEDDAFS